MTPDRESVTVPLYSRNGSIRASTRIDEADAGFVNQWRWTEARGYAVRWKRDAAGRLHRIDLHRELLGLRPGDGLEGDHRNRDRLDNRRSNLRVVTKAQNGQNKPSYPGTSQYRGVSYIQSRGKWSACVRRGNRPVFQKYFETEREAAEAASAARRSLMPYAVEDDRAYRRLAGGAS
jgi:hypothetical protein